MTSKRLTNFNLFRQKAILITGLCSIFLSSIYAQTCPGTDAWKWPSHSNWVITQNGLATRYDFKTSVTTEYRPWAMQGGEGQATVSDDNGNLLFTTNGRSIIAGATLNKVVCTNCLTAGDGGFVNLSSSAQGTLIVKHPLIPNKYFIFCLDDANSGLINGLDFFTYDASTQTISAGTTLWGDRTGEGAAATIHANGIDIWVTTYDVDKNKFYTYLIDCNGLNTTPIITAAATTQMTDKNMGQGAHEFSWDSKKFATAYQTYSNNSQTICLYDFDNATGAITNPQFIANTTVQTGQSYDIEFSPNNQYLYSSGNDGQLVSYNISSGITTTIRATALQIRAALFAPGQDQATIEIGGDGMLYYNSYQYHASHDGQILRFKDTNGDNRVDTQEQAIYSGARFSGTLGLSTTFLPPSLVPVIDPANLGPFCFQEDDPVDLNTKWKCKGGVANVNAEDGNQNYSGPGITNALTGMFDPDIAGVGTHQIIFKYCKATDTVWIQVNDCSCLDTTIGNPASICTGSNLDLAPLEITPDPGTWSIVSTPVGINPATINGTTFTTTATTLPGSYTIRFTLSGVQGAICPKYSERILVVKAKPAVSISNQSMCAGGTAITFDAGAQGVGAVFAWTPSGENTQTISAGTAGTYSVTVTSANGCSNNAAATLTVNSKPTVSLSNKAICAGAAAVSFDAGTQAAGSVFAWTPNGENTQTISTNTAGTYTVTVTNAKGCSSNASAILSISAKPTVSLSNQAMCAGGTAVTFDAGAQSAGSVFAWTPNGENTQSISAGTAGTYSVTVTNSAGCSNSANATLTVNSKPTVNLGNDKAICPGGSTTLDAGSGFTTYTWSGAGNGSSQTLITSTGGTYTVTVTNANGCSASDAVVVTVNATLNIIIGNDTAICAGKSITFDANYNGAGVTYNWSGPNGFSASSNPIIANTDGTYQVDVTDPLGCQGQADVKLTINSLPIITVADAAVCAGKMHSFDAGTFTSYNWTGPVTGTSRTLSTNTAGTYTATVTDYNGCQNSDAATLTVNNNPQLSIGSDYTACSGTVKTFTSNLNGLTYLWSTGATTPSIDVSTGGTYSLEVSDAKNCKGYDTALATFTAIPVLDIGDDINLCEGERQIITADVTPSNSMVTWNSGESGKTISVSTSRKVLATANNGGNCSSMDSITVTIFPKPIINGPDDTTLCLQSLPDGFELDAGTNATQYLWSNGMSTQKIKIFAEGNYTVALSNAANCSSTDTISIIEDCPSSLFSPNAFTPNQDGSNDVFCMKGDNIYDFEMWIFNRWGEVIFHSTDIHEGWNGKKMNTMNDVEIDVYVWKITYKDWEKWKRNKAPYNEIGSVAVIR